VATNQPAAAKGKTTLANLQATHGRVLEEAQSAGGVIQGSYICYHRSEDRCKCRKPAPGLLEAAFRDHGGTHRDAVWMVGDGVTDVEAGTRFGAKTAFLGPRKCDACKVFEGCSLKPEFWSDNLLSFVYFLERS
jgi:D-glycero-D-manno-heptose 1,7-bisphosphate phosphatase